MNTRPMDDDLDGLSHTERPHHAKAMRSALRRYRDAAGHDLRWYCHHPEPGDCCPMHQATAPPPFGAMLGGVHARLRALSTVA